MPATPPTLQRGDRHIARSRIRMGRDTPRQRTLLLLAEALRLAALPGEDQGRVYFFRSVSFGKLPAHAGRKVWLDRIQLVLTHWATCATHGASSQAAVAGAVYFRHRQEALELLLLRLLRRESTGEWYWPLVDGTSPGMNGAERIARLVDTLRESPGGWVAAANAIFAVLAIVDAVSLLALLPAPRVQTWLRELGSTEAAGAPLAIPPETTAPVLRAVEWFGAGAPQTLWLASLAVAMAAPATLPARSAVARGRAVLRQLGQRAPATLKPIPETTPPPTAEAEPPDTQAVSPLSEISAAAISAPRPAATLAPTLEASLPAPGEFTAYAGFYFLLNVLERLGIGRSPALADAGFVPELMERLAGYAGLPLTASRLLSKLGPVGTRGPQSLQETSRDCPREIRVFLVGVRRWCWRSARLTLREVVTRPGVVCWTRTDLDILMPLDSTDARIRRVGLDLDPGWVPWFGRVVHFHYRNNWEDGLHDR